MTWTCSATVRLDKFSVSKPGDPGADEELDKAKKYRRARHRSVIGTAEACRRRLRAVRRSQGEDLSGAQCARLVYFRRK